MTGFKPRTSGIGSDCFYQLSHNHCPLIVHYHLQGKLIRFTRMIRTWVEGSKNIPLPSHV